MKTTPSRRSFLKLAAACTAPAFGSLAFAAPQTQQKFDKVADVIVIGSGFAGLAAALEAKEKGASVMLLEKMPAYGGNSAINGGAFAVAGSPLQEKEGIKDSPELMLQDMIKSGRGLSHVDLLKNMFTVLVLLLISPSSTVLSTNLSFSTSAATASPVSCRPLKVPAAASLVRSLKQPKTSGWTCI